MFDKISVIIPTYNNEATIQRCIESLIGQSYKNFEAIIIDDGSYDSTPLICDQIDDPRFIVKHVSNGGVSSARNLGLSLVTGSYVCFCDGDDYYEKDFLLKLYEGIVTTSSDLAICNYYIQRNHSRFKYNNSKNKEISRFELIKGFTSTNEYGGFSCNKIFKGSIIKKCHYQKNISIMEDTVFLLDYLFFCNKIYYIDDPLYDYCESTTVKDPRRIINKVTNDVKYLEAYDYILKNHDLNNAEIKLIKSEMCYMAFSIVLWIQSFDLLSKSLKQNLLSRGYSNLNVLMLNPFFNWKKKAKTIKNIVIIKLLEIKK